MSPSYYAPGDSAPETGVFQAVHRSHCFPQQVLLNAGEQFPSCPKCEVKFRLVRSAAQTRTAAVENLAQETKGRAKAAKTGQG